MEWHNFKNSPPTEEKSYLWAVNNWNVFDGMTDNKIHSYYVRTAYWDGHCFREYNNHILRDPDEWAEIPYPTPRERPKTD